MALGLIVSLLTSFGGPALSAGPGEDRRAPATRGITPADGQDLRLEVVAPLLWTSSVISADSDGNSIDQPDWHTLPEVSLNWSHQFDSVWVSQTGALVFDRYRDVSSADTNTIETETLAALTEGKSDVFVPYLRYAFTSYYERDFESLDDRRHDIWAGVTSDSGFRNGQTIAYRDATKPGDTIAGFDLYAGRRLANDVSVQHWVAGAKLTFGYIVSDDLELSLAPGVRVRMYDDELGFPDRTDVRFGALAKATWTPGWLTGRLKNSKIVFSAEYQNNLSSDSFAEYEYWELGPSLSLQTRF